MDDLISNLSLPELGVALVFAISGSIFLIQKLKMLVCTHWKGQWTQSRWFKLVWLAAAFVVPLGLVVLLTQHYMLGFMNQYLPASMKLTPADASGGLGSTLMASVVGNGGAYSVLKNKGWLGDYRAGGPNDVTPAPVTQESSGDPLTPSNNLPTVPVCESTTTVQSEQTNAVVPQTIEPSQNGSDVSQNGTVAETGNVPNEETPYNPVPYRVPPSLYVPKHAAPETQLFELTLVETDEPVWLTEPTDRSPNHVMIPRGWRG